MEIKSSSFAPALLISEYMRESVASESEAEIDAILVFPSSRFPMSFIEEGVILKNGGSFLFVIAKEYS